MISEVLAIVATVVGVIVSLGGIPQILKILKRKSSSDVSITMILIILVGYLVWLFYGWSIMNYPLLITNVTGIIVFSTALAVTIKYHKGKKW